jgi:hypothetical protein
VWREEREIPIFPAKECPSFLVGIFYPKTMDKEETERNVLEQTTDR